MKILGHRFFGRGCNRLFHICVSSKVINSFNMQSLVVTGTEKITHNAYKRLRCWYNGIVTIFKMKEKSINHEPMAERTCVHHYNVTKLQTETNVERKYSRNTLHAMAPRY